MSHYLVWHKVLIERAIREGLKSAPAPAPDKDKPKANSTAQRLLWRLRGMK